MSNPTQTIERLQTEDSRFYKITKDDGKVLYFPSVTTIFQHVKVNSYFLDNWKEEQAEKLGMLGKRIQLFLDAERGVAVHKAIERWNNGENLDWKKDRYTDEEWARITRYMQWEEETQPKFHCNEQLVYSEKYGYAGQTDGIVEIEGKKYIIDFKTGKDIYDTHLMQASAYLHAYNEMVEDKELEGIIVLALAARTKKGWKMEVMTLDDSVRYFDGFLKHKELFDWANEEFEPSHELLPASFNHD